ncbi:MAG: glycoside hydrolase family 28 protein [Ignavibacteriales bacterium]|nr:glycoside hydrolase family 28 protein [Ignavibacteriales bacterium]
MQSKSLCKNRSTVIRIFLVIFLSSIFINSIYCNDLPKNNSTGWKQLPKILSNIKKPVFPKKDYRIQLTSEADARAIIQESIDKCSASGGGRVIIQKGNYFVNGPINLKSNVNLHFEDGVLLKFSTNPDDYLPIVKTRWEGIECYNYSALIYAYDQKNIAITGKGILDGQATNENWWRWKGNKEFGWTKDSPSQNDSLGRPLLVKMNLEQVRVEQRIFGKGHYLRPNFIQLCKCKNILIEGVTFLNSPMWVIHPLLSQNITIQEVSTIGSGPNTDGCDPESCKDVLIKDCFFKNGDDNIAIKSGRNNDGRRINVSSENIVIQNCKMKDGHGGVTIGSEISGGCRNVFAENCEMDSPNLDRAIRIKANTFRGGIVENIFIRNIKVGEVGDAVIHFDMKYEPKEGEDGGFLPVWRNIDIRNITSSKSKFAMFLIGLKNSPIKNLVIENCEFNQAAEKSVLENVENPMLKNLFINSKPYAKGVNQ